MLFSAQRGVLVFAMDNPDTKPIAFSERLLAEVRQRYPEAIFLSKTFTLPAVMKQLANMANILPECLQTGGRDLDPFA